MLLSEAIFNDFLIASFDQTPPVGLDGVFMIIPFVLGVILDLRSSKSGSKFLSIFVLTNIGVASANITNSGKDTQ